MAITENEINIRFSPPKMDQDRLAIKGRICDAARTLALLIHELVPGCREESIAISAIEDAVNAAHNGIDRRYVAQHERKNMRPDGRTVAARLDGGHGAI